MKRLRFSYYLRIQFDSSVSEHHFTIKCVPVDTSRQTIEGLEVSVFPDNDLSRGEDSFGNQCIYGYCGVPHDHFEIRVSGEAEAGRADSEPGESAHMLGRYRYPTHYTVPGPGILDFYASLRERMPADPYGQSAYLMRAVYDRLTYRQGVTDIHTTAEEAMELGEGVCQDYAHIMIALCHLAGLPARYVVGMLLGEGASHAWVETCCCGRWYAFDPTNNVVVEDSHIKISKGRDYKDCLINQGTFLGRTTNQEQRIQVLVEEIT